MNSTFLELLLQELLLQETISQRKFDNIMSKISELQDVLKQQADAIATVKANFENFILVAQSEASEVKAAIDAISEKLSNEEYIPNEELQAVLDSASAGLESLSDLNSSSTLASVKNAIDNIYTAPVPPVVTSDDTPVPDPGTVPKVDPMPQPGTPEADTVPETPVPDVNPGNVPLPDANNQPIPDPNEPLPSNQV